MPEERLLRYSLCIRTYADAALVEPGDSSREPREGPRQVVHEVELPAMQSVRGSTPPRRLPLYLLEPAHCSSTPRFEYVAQSSTRPRPHTGRRGRRGSDRQSTLQHHYHTKTGLRGSSVRLVQFTELKVPHGRTIYMDI